MRTTTRVRGAAAAVVAVLAMAAGACSEPADGGGTVGGDGSGGGTETPDLQLASSLQPVETCEGLSGWLSDEVAPRVTEYGLSGGVTIMEMPGGARASEDDAEVSASAESAPMAGDSAAEPAPTAPTGADADFSGTNVQVAGVDEPDLVKTDGERILAVTGGRLHLVSVAEGRELAALDLPPDLGVTDLLLAGDRALAIGTSWAAVPFDRPTDDVAREREIAPQGTASTVLAEIDLSGDALALGDTFALEGSYVSARMTGDVARLVLHASPADRLGFVAPANGSDVAIAAAKAHNRSVVEEATPEDLLPRWHRLDDAGEPVEDGPLLGCEGVHAPNTYAGFALVAVASVDLGEGLAAGVTSADGTGVLASGDTVYASPEHLYVAAPEWIDPMSSTDDAVDIQPMPAGGTDIHRFDITDPSRAVYELSGRVDGTLLGQFALDEHGGNLRVATTTGFSWASGGDAEESQSHVTVLAPGDGALEAVGKVSGLGPGEDIYSVRFLGDVGYVVTFERTDPLYAIDLSDPAAPQVTGELEIPGYSSYLHPVADGWLLGVGQDATTDGMTTGTQVSLFDVRDPAAPTRVAQVDFPGAHSTAESDHRAFLWWADDGLVALPLTECSTSPGFDGVVGISVDAAAGTLAERGRVTHGGEGCWYGIDPPMPMPEPRPMPMPVEPDAGGGSDSSSGSAGSSGATAPSVSPVEPPPFDDTRAPTPVLRSLVIGDRLWTLSEAGMAHADLATLAGTVAVPFT